MFLLPQFMRKYVDTYIGMLLALFVCLNRPYASEMLTRLGKWTQVLHWIGGPFAVIPAALVCRKYARTSEMKVLTDLQTLAGHLYRIDIYIYNICMTS
jgi:hypothetical protein